jgi:Dolichyl-phosphate-mannose-protein mannosyltransferase
MIPFAKQPGMERSWLSRETLFDRRFLAGLLVLAGFVVRLKLAAATFLNADEALHFMAANQDSWKLTYRASLTVSHPPLLIFLLHVWRMFGSSEIILRLPSVVAGAAFGWIFFRWLSLLFGTGTGLIGLIFASFLPPMIALSAEVRQYAFLLVFAISALYLLEQALAENSAVKMACSGVCLWLATLSHYSAALLAAALAAYTLLRMWKRPPTQAVFRVWLAGEMGELLLGAVLYLTYLSEFGRNALHGWMGDTYLHNSYFDPQRHHILLFVFTRSASVFQYVLGQAVIGDLLFLLFLAATVAVWRTAAVGSIEVPGGQLAALLWLPFVINCGAGLLDLYPYGGTRHSIFLAIFAITGISVALFRMVGRRLIWGMAVAVAVVVLSNLFPSHRLPYIARADQKKYHMDQAMAFVRERIPRNDLLLADNQTSLLLGHYLCQQPFFINEWTEGLNSLRCGGFRIAATEGSVYTFTAENFLPSWEQVVRAYGLNTGDSVWVLQGGWRWEDSLAFELQTQYPELRDLKIYSFGHNLTIFQLKVGQLKFSSS